MKDKEGNLLNIYEIKIPWLNYDPMKYQNEWLSRSSGDTVYELTPREGHLTIENGVLKIDFSPDYAPDIKTASDLNKISVAVENPDYNYLDPTSVEFFYDTEPHSLAAYTALNSWEPYTGIEEEAYGVAPDSVSGKYGKLGDNTYLLQQTVENPDYDASDVSTGDEYFYNQWVK